MLMEGREVVGYFIKEVLVGWWGAKRSLLKRSDVELLSSQSEGTIESCLPLLSNLPYIGAGSFADPKYQLRYDE
jgi:hypothetical protein